MTQEIRSLVLGIGFGAALGTIGFSDFEEIHRMFLFADLRLTLTFATAVVLLFVGFRIWKRFGTVKVSARPIHSGTLPGALLFGAGWALCGACPSIAFVQLGEGQLGAIASLLGMVLGNLLFATINGRVVHVPSNGCAEN